MPCLFLTGDLMSQSRLGGVPGLRVTDRLDKVGGPEEDLSDTVVVLDLNLASLDPHEVVGRLRALPKPPKAFLAFGPHVQEDRLAAAHAAGCDLVITKGEFHARGSQIVNELLARPARSDK